MGANNTSTISYTFTKNIGGSGVLWVITIGHWNSSICNGAIGTVKYKANDVESATSVIADKHNIISDVSIDNSTGVFTVTLVAAQSYLGLKILNI